jgi:isoamylase
VLRFVKLLCKRRLLLNSDVDRRYANLSQLLRMAERTWHGVKLGHPDWSVTSHSVALYADARGQGLLIYLILNQYWEPLDFELPPASDGNPWRRWIDTSLDSPNDIDESETAQPIMTPTYRAGPRSVIVLFAREQA